MAEPTIEDRLAALETDVAALKAAPAASSSATLEKYEEALEKAGIRISDEEPAQAEKPVEETASAV